VSLEATVTEARASRLRGKVAIVTGAAGGVGRGIADRLAAAGAAVIVTSRDRARADALAAELRSDGRAVHGRHLDVTDPTEVQQAVSAVAAEYGRVDLLVNNAARMHIAPLLDTSLADWEEVFRVNVGSVLIGVQAAVRQMRGQEPDPATGRRGAILNVSSPAADNVAPLEAAYGASKAAVNHLTRTSARLFADDLIAITALYPGNVWEGMQGVLHRHAGDPPGEPGGPSARAKLDAWPTGRWQRPSDTGDLAVFVAAFEGMGLNGELIVAHAHRHRL